MATASPPSDWQVGKTLIESFDHLLTSGIASDVTFIVGEERNRISAHKLVLLSRSPVFYAMLEGPMAEKGEIIIPDISAETFRSFLRYLYTDKIDLTDRNVVPVFNAARKYCVDILVSRCEKFLSENLTIDSACVLLEQAHLFMMESLKDECLTLILENALDVLQSTSFTNLCLKSVASITESDELQAGERDVYEAVIRWAEAECARQKIEATAENKKDVLGETLYTVRFLHLHEGFLLGKICSDMILNSDDIRDIINHRRNNKALISEKIMTTKRCLKTRRYYRNGPVHNGIWGSQPADEAISFKSTGDLSMLGFGSFLTNVGQSSVDLKVFEDDVCLVQTCKPREQPNPDTPCMGDVLLDTQIQIHAGKTYTILEHSQHTVNHYFETGITHVTHQDVTIEFINSFKSRHSNTNRGQIPYVILSR
ncbi:BTB/POZ domain-containing protein 1-like [Pecten maximus]|uniref:BTB/POZ domain-containing protein 1-like n=1 Tax=Pecten maximus TaxID=6579 RepID=UPI001458C36C|nr:BTB/POZ domain-containing protein 1-like [Pecten maximus]